MNLPLLIGGATTSKVHTAVKIDENYSGNVIHVLDASKAVAVAGKLLNVNSKENFVNEVASEYETIRVQHKRKNNNQNLISIVEARKNKLVLDWGKIQIT